jgi:starch synthase
LSKPRVLFAAAEMAPLAKAGGLGDVTGALPAVLRKAGLDVRMIMPLYKCIKEQYAGQLRFRRWAMVKMGWRSQYSGLFSMDVGGVPTYLVDNEYYFGHRQIYMDYTFDIERFSFFQRAVLEALGQPMDFAPDILHLNDWHTAMIPCLLDAHYRDSGYQKQLKTILTIHNLKFQGISSRERIADLMDLPDRYMTSTAILKDGVPNFMKGGIVFTDRITTVSPTYASEIMTEQYGEGLHILLKQHACKLSGFLNGIDTHEYDPQADPLLASNYDLASWQEGKPRCKLALQEELGLQQDVHGPLACVVSRLTEQKGIELFIRVAGDLLDHDLQLAVLGTGEPNFEAALSELAARHRGRMAVCLSFDTDLAHRFYAGADLLLMPSLFEPCGLAQMIALRYGTLPVVRETGGLKDTVHKYNQATGQGNGFSFREIRAQDFLDATLDAAALYQTQPGIWAAMVKSAMSGDYSWDRTATGYSRMYEELTN